MYETSDLTIVYYTANEIPPSFGTAVRNQLFDSVKNRHMPVVCVSKKPVDDIFGFNNIISPHDRSHISIYRDALLGAKAAKTKYIALCEDDVLYSPEHFKYRPSEGKFAYNLGHWNIHTWGDVMFTHKGTNRSNLHGLICERALFIAAMEERFEKFPDAGEELNKVWAEPGKYEGHLGVTQRSTEVFYTNPPNIVFIHQTALAFGNLGTRKKVGEFRATEIPYWGKAKDIRRLYEEV